MVHCKAWEPLLLPWGFRELCLSVVSLSQDLVSRPVSRLEGLAVHLSKLAVDVELWWPPKRLVVLSVQAGVWLRASAV